MFDRLQHLTRISNIKDDCQCLICHQEFKRYCDLGLHLTVVHKNMNSKKYYDRYFLKDKEDRCICGKKKKFISIKHGYNKFCSLSCGSSRKRNRTGKKNNLTDAQRKQLSDRAKKSLYPPGTRRQGGRCKWYKIGDVLLQGNYELYYYLKNKKKLKLKDCDAGVETPYGLYFPDFETEEKYIEIKSEYTIKTFQNSKQSKKIDWVIKNIKNVEVIQPDGKLVYAFIKTLDLEKYIIRFPKREREKMKR